MALPSQAPSTSNVWSCTFNFLGPPAEHPPPISLLSPTTSQALHRLLAGLGISYNISRVDRYSVMYTPADFLGFCTLPLPRAEVLLSAPYRVLIYELRPQDHQGVEPTGVLYHCVLRVRSPVSIRLSSRCLRLAAVTLMVRMEVGLQRRMRTNRYHDQLQAGPWSRYSWHLPNYLLR